MSQLAADTSDCSRISFEQLIMELSSAFTAIEPSRVDAAILAALRDLADFFDADRATFTEIEGHAIKTNQFYSRPGVSGADYKVPVGTQLPYYTRNMVSGQSIVLSDLLNALPSEAEPERRFCAQIGMKSILAVPLKIAGEFRYALTVSTFLKEAAWTEELVPRVRLIGEILVNATSRRLAFEAEEDHRQRLEEKVRVRTQQLERANWQLKREISERRQIADALAQSEERYRNVYTHAPVAFVVWDMECKVTEWNEQAERIFGWSKAEALGKRFLDLIVPPQSMAAVETIVSRLLRGQTAGRKVRENVTKDGSRIYCEWNSSALHDHNGGVIGAISIGLDVTERMQAEQEQDKARQTAEEANRAKSAFLATMSHEIRTPLNAVIGFSELLSNEVTDEKMKAHVSSILTAGRSLLTLTNDILDLSKIEAGMMELKKAPVDVQQVAKQLEAIFDAKRREKGIDFQIEIADGIPQVFMLDEIRVRQVLLNLVGNALKFTEQGSVTVKVDAEPKDERWLLSIAVEDTGIGIALDDQATIFDSFKQQSMQDSRKYGGTGLGLAICKHLVEVMEGDITLSSKPGQGSRFTVRLSDVEAVAHVKSIAAPESSMNTDIYFDVGHVLIVEDVKMNRKMLQSLLEKVGLETSTAVDGEEAVSKAKSLKPDLILMDLKMPGMDGTAACEIIKGDPLTSAIPVVALTAAAEKEERENALRAGFDSFLIKPIDGRRLFTEICRFMSCTEGGDPCTSGDPSELPDALVDRLVNELLPAARAMVGGMKVSETLEMATRLHDLCEETEARSMLKMADDLYSAAKRYQIKKIDQMLRRIVSYLERLEDQ